MKKQNESIQGTLSDPQPKGRKVLRLHRETLRMLTDQEMRAVAGATGFCGGNPTYPNGCTVTLATCPG